MSTVPTDSVLRRHHEQMLDAARSSMPAESGTKGGPESPGPAPDIPTDSVLRRHYEQMRQAARLVPTDSVLRRHYEQMQQAARSGVGSSRTSEPVKPAAPPREPPPVAKQPSAAPEPAVGRRPAPEPVAARQGGGFLGWLKRLFGG